MTVTATAFKENNKKVHNIAYATRKIQNFLDDKSPNTAKNYKIDINYFTQFLFQKDLQYVREHELENVTADDVLSYRNEIKINYSNSTVNRRINALKSLFKYLEASNPKIRRAIFNVAKSLQENPKPWGTLTWEEVEEMIERAKDFDDKEELSILIEVATKTCIRLTALLNLEWSQIYDKQQKGDIIKVIEVMDKGKPHAKPISDKLYERIMTLKESKRPFINYYPHKIAHRLDSIKADMNISESRNISFHSFKKAGVNYVFDTTGDIMLAQQQANHQSSATTMKSYLQHKTDLREIPSYTMGENIDSTILESLTKEELLQAIDELKSSSKLELLRIIKEKREG